MINSDDVKQDDFLITIELYSYELFNTASNIIQSARKLAKQLTDFATFKKGSNNNNQQQQNQPLHSFQNNGGTISSQSNSNALLQNNNYSYSMHKFKLVATSQLTQNDINEQYETRNLDLINEPIKSKNNGITKF